MTMPENTLTANSREIALLTPYTPKLRMLDKYAKRLLIQRLQLLQNSEIVLQDNQETIKLGNPCISAGGLAPIHVKLEVLDSRFYGEVVFGGSIGAGEAYMQGYFKCDNLTDLIRIFARNQSLLDGIESGWARLTRPIQKVLHAVNKNTQRGSRKNISAHYDLGNDFFALMLDPTMMYSCGIFETPESSLEQSSIAKLDAICQKLDLKPGDQVMEIGTGWGGFAIHAATHYGCHVTTTTISQAQYALAKERVDAAGLQNNITLLLQDYRDLQGQYDKLVSIEMIEAVGYQFYDTFFAKCSSLLKPNGMMLLQAITITDQRYEAAKNSVDFIQRYIFPGSCIPSNTAMLQSITRASDLRLYDLLDIGPHYATTLAKWRENFFANLEQVKALGYPQAFINMWEFYLCYCEGGFAERALGDVHMLLVKPENRKPALA